MMPVINTPGDGMLLRQKSKQHSLQVVELSQRIQTAVQIGSKPPTPAMGAQFTVFGQAAMRTRWMTGAAPHKSE